MARRRVYTHVVGPHINSIPPQFAEVEVSMSATSVVSIAKSSLSWSIIFSILMILAGVAAIAMPPVAGLAVNIVIAWLLLFSATSRLMLSLSARQLVPRSA